MTAFTRRTCLVTGGAGFIGSHLVEALVRRGHTVRVLDNLSTGKLANLEQVRDRIEFLRGDLLDAPLVARALRGAEWVFHQAALASVPRSVERPLETHAACATGTLILLDAARRSGVRRLVAAGSSSAYGNQARRRKCEEDAPAPLSPYGAAKLAAEYYCRAFTVTYGFSTVVLRYFNVFGPRQDPGSPYAAVIPRFITAALEGRRPVIFGDGAQSRDFTFVEDVVAANLLAAAADQVSGRVVNIANGRKITLLEVLAEINRLLGTRIAPVHALPRPGDIRESLADIRRARRLLGYQPSVDFPEALRRTIDSYRPPAARPDSRPAPARLA